MEPDNFEELVELLGFRWDYWASTVRKVVNDKTYSVDDRFALFCKYPFVYDVSDHNYMGELNKAVGILAAKYGVEDYEYSVDNELERYVSRSAESVFDTVVDDFMDRLPFGKDPELYQDTVSKFEAELKELLI